MIEQLLVVDDTNSPAGYAARQEVEQSGLIARVAHVIVTDKKGNLLCQKRADTAKVWPGAYTSTGSGHVDAGESDQQAAARELFEEAGIKINEKSLQHIDTFYLEHLHGHVLNRRFHVIFHAVLDSAVDTKVQLSEVSELRWFATTEIVQKISEDSSSFAPAFQKYFQQYFSSQA